jgi:hypothetical protein
MKRLILAFTTIASIILTHGLAFLASVGSHSLGLNGWITATIYVAIIALASAFGLWSTEARCFIIWAESEPPKPDTTNPSTPEIPQELTPRDTP